jgi:signal transduction histidine kinase
MTLRAKLLSLFAALGVTPFLALGVFNYARSMEALEGLIRSRTDSIAQHAAQEIGHLYAQRQSDLLLLAENAETQRLFLAHTQGNPDAWEAALSAARPYLERAWEIVGASYRWVEFRDPESVVLYFLESDPSARKQQTGPGFDMLELEQPIFDIETSRELGTLSTSIHLDAILPRERLDTSFGQDGYSVVFNRKTGLILYHPRRAYIQQNASELLGKGWRLDSEILSNDSGSFTFREEESSRVASFVNLSTPPWTVISTASMDEFAAPFVRTRITNIVVVILITATIAVAFYLLTRRATHSLVGLTEAADEIAGGNLAPALPPAGSDEVGRLSSAFAVMVKEVREMLRRIEQSRHMAAIGRFASQLSHEIRNPLTSLKLNLQSLDRDVSSRRIPQDCARPVQICLREINRLDRVVRDALSLARTRGSTLELCSVHNCLGDAANVIRPQLDGQEIVLKTELRARDDTVRGDSEKLKGAFLNLLLNGADAMPNGGRLQISTDMVDAKVRVRIADEGPGIPKELKEKIFEPFYSTKKEGTGFGLAIALQAVEEHQGSIRVTDVTAGKGAVFVVELPLAPQEKSI